MKYTLIFALLFLTPFFTIAQSHAVKGMIFGFPKLYFIGAGYELSLKNNFTAQISWQHFGFDQSDTDGPEEHTHTLTPEIKYYFGDDQGLLNKVYFGLFTELARTRIEPSGEQAPNYFLISGTKDQVSPGILAGMNISFSERWFLEVFFGGKYRFFSTEKSYIINQKEEIVVQKDSRPGLRAGIFIGYAF